MKLLEDEAEIAAKSALKQRQKREVMECLAKPEVAVLVLKVRLQLTPMFIISIIIISS